MDQINWRTPLSDDEMFALQDNTVLNLRYLGWRLGRNKTWDIVDISFRLYRPKFTYIGRYLKRNDIPRYPRYIFFSKKIGASQSIIKKMNKALFFLIQLLKRSRSSSKYRTPSSPEKKIELTLLKKIELPSLKTIKLPLLTSDSSRLLSIFDYSISLLTVCSFVFDQSLYSLHVCKLGLFLF